MECLLVEMMVAPTVSSWVVQLAGEMVSERVVKMVAG